MSFLILEPILPKRCTRAAKKLLPSYNIVWLISTKFYLDAVSLFQEFIFGMAFCAIDPIIYYSISSTITSAVATALAFAQTKHKEKMLALREMIEKAMLLRESSSPTPPSNPNMSSKLYLPADLPLKSIKR